MTCIQGTLSQQPSSVLGKPCFSRGLSEPRVGYSIRFSARSDIKTGLTKHRKEILVGICLGICLATIAKLNILSFPWFKPGVPSQQIGWSDKIQVYAGGGQRQSTYNEDSPAESTILSNYARHLIMLLNTLGINSLEEAQKILEKRGYPTLRNLMTQFPISTANRSQFGWKKGDKTVTRYILTAAVDEFAKDGPLIADRVKGIYQIPDSQIQNLSGKVSKAQFIIAAKDLADRIRQERPTQPVEILFYMDLHGSNTALFPFLASGDEGNAEGVVQFSDAPLFESELKAVLNFLFEDLPVKLTMIMATCKSGSWIADNQPVVSGLPEIG